MLILSCILTAFLYILWEVCVFHVHVAKFDSLLLNLAVHLQEGSKKYDILIHVCKRNDHLGNLGVNYVKIDVKALGYKVNSLKQLYNGLQWLPFLMHLWVSYNKECID